MRKTLLCIISIFIFFSTENALGLNEISLEGIYGLENDIFVEKVNNLNIEYYAFQNKGNISKQNAVSKVIGLLKNSVIQAYSDGNIDYNKTNCMIADLETYIYYSNEYFSNLKEIENHPYLKKDKEFQYQIQTVNENLLISLRNLKRTFNY